MRYIGPFFRMNSLTQKEINTQLFYLSKEAIKTIVLESKCGLVYSVKNLRKIPSLIDITTISNYSPLLCVYRKASPNFIHNKNSNGFDEETFKKDINSSTNALMTLCLLELTDYYRTFENIDKNNYALHEIYKVLSKEQLEFYSVNLRNSEGVFVDKKNLLESNYKNFNLVDKDKKFKFSDQAFMMIAYYVYWLKNPNDDVSLAYKSFALEILQMFIDFTDKLYDNSLDELCKILLAFNILYSYEAIGDLQTLIVDLADYVMYKFDEKDYYVDSLDLASLCSISLTMSYKHTKILSFLDKSKIIIDKLYSLYDQEKEVFYKLSSKKEIKYSSSDITFYFLAFIIYSNITERQNEYRGMLSSIYKKFIVNSGILTSWPDAPTLDDYERYRGLSLNSSDMLDESCFRMPNIPTPESVGIAPVFNKYITYNKRKDTFQASKLSFDSYKNFFNYYLFIYLFKENYLDETRSPHTDEAIIDELILPTTTIKNSDFESEMTQANFQNITDKDSTNVTDSLEDLPMIDSSTKITLEINKITDYTFDDSNPSDSIVD